jgi:hypothetical protein
MVIPALVAMLLEKGLSMIGGAVLAKGQAVVEDKLGISLKTPPTQAELIEWKKLEVQESQWLMDQMMKGRQQEADFQKQQEEAVTARWQADTSTDSTLAKNIRPMVLIYLLGAYTVLAIMSAFKYSVEESYVLLLGQWGMIVMTAYFGGRTLEKIISIKNGGK